MYPFGKHNVNEKTEYIDDLNNIVGWCGSSILSKGKAFSSFRHIFTILAFLFIRIEMIGL